MLSLLLQTQIRESSAVRSVSEAMSLRSVLILISVKQRSNFLFFLARFSNAVSSSRRDEMFIERATPKDSSSLQRSETELDLRTIAGNIALRWSAGRGS